MARRAFVFVTAMALVFSPATAAAPPRSGVHDFDPQIGHWHTELRRLAHPLSGSTEWVEYSGTTVTTPVWGGKANLVELEVNGPAGAIEGLSLRLFDPRSGQWSVNYANSRSGALDGAPVSGAFTNGRGEFYGTDTADGRTVLVRFLITPQGADRIHFEQSYSADGGRTWETNWIATDTRLP